ncbi:MAG: glutathione S-transferase [Rhodospirillum sp.]|nr:glutathione S-transferase [Rhodospirillum sp.]MCF8491867.1 glutathione S-transferase [Rhodospirillum sp.]MCF8502513.1 glutathione S-transferase [Rhodospirillum sp.]
MTQAKMRLRHSPNSPYVRKVMAMAHEIGLVDQLELVPTFVWEDDTDIHKDNPLGKVPALILSDGTVLPESVLICLYLDDLHGGTKLFPDTGEDRIQALRWLALGDGLTNSAVARTIEFNRRPEHERGTWWPERMKRAVTGTLHLLERESSTLTDSPLNIGHIAIGVALGYLDFRFADEFWRDGHPGLSAWYEDFAKRPSMVDTEPPKP